MEIGCPGCGHTYTPEEFKELLDRRGGGEVPKPAFTGSCSR
ncbi:MAG: hypothetical protein ACYDIC_16955 [Desulfobaccales bacterium]